MKSLWLKQFMSRSLHSCHWLCLHTLPEWSSSTKSHNCSLWRNGIIAMTPSLHSSPACHLLQHLPASAAQYLWNYVRHQVCGTVRFFCICRSHQGCKSFRLESVLKNSVNSQTEKKSSEVSILSTNAFSVNSRDAKWLRSKSYHDCVCIWSSLVRYSLALRVIGHWHCCCIWPGFNKALLLAPLVQNANCFSWLSLCLSWEAATFKGCICLLITSHLAWHGKVSFKCGWWMQPSFPKLGGCIRWIVLGLWYLKMHCSPVF